MRKGQPPPDQPRGKRVRSPRITTERGNATLTSTGPSVPRSGEDFGGIIVYPAPTHKLRGKWWRWLQQHAGVVLASPCEWLTHSSWHPPMSGEPVPIPSAFLVVGNTDAIEALKGMPFVLRWHPALDVKPPHRAGGMGNPDSPAMRRHKRDRTLCPDLADVKQRAKLALAESIVESPLTLLDPTYTSATVERAQRAVVAYERRLAEHDGAPVLPTHVPAPQPVPIPPVGYLAPIRPVALTSIGNGERVLAEGALAAIEAQAGNDRQRMTDATTPVSGIDSLDQSVRPPVA